MSAREPETTLLSGWGRVAPTGARVHEPRDDDELVAAVKQAGPRGIVARGLGRSYGDAAQNAGGDVLVTTSMNRIYEIDAVKRTARVQAGVSLDALMREAVPRGLWPVVTPGTRQVTIGGAIACDVHGKNHHRDLTFGTHVPSLTVVTPVGVLVVGPDDPAGVFWATVGGMGLTGIISEATVELLPIQTDLMRVDSERAGNLDAALERMAESDRDYRYSVAWIDCLARGHRLGRSIIEFADHAGRDDLPRRHRGRPPVFRPFDRARAPAWAPSGLLNRWTVGAFNEIWYRKSPARASGHLVPLGTFFHPLDLVSDWNRIYGRRGFIQYQLVVPDGAEDSLRSMVEAVSSSRAASFLAVLKRFGPANPAPLSFPRPGWTLALDLPAVPELAPLLDRLDGMVSQASGRVYLAKDSRLRPDVLESMYPDLPAWRAIRNRLDPEGILQSDMARRLPALSATAPVNR